MQRKLRTLEILAAGASVWLSSVPAYGQSCNCQNPAGLNGERLLPSIPFEASNGFPSAGDYVSRGYQSSAEARASLNYNYAQQPSSRLPAGWPNQWSGPAVTAQTPTNGSSSPAASQTSREQSALAKAGTSATRNGDAGGEKSAKAEVKEQSSRRTPVPQRTRRY